VIGFTRTATHDRIVAGFERDLADRKSMGVKLFAANLKLARENAELRAKLNKFTGPRGRSADGRFVPAKSPVDRVLDALHVEVL